MSNTYKHKGKGYWNNGIEDKSKLEVQKYLKHCNRHNSERGYFKKIELNKKEQIADDEMEREMAELYNESGGLHLHDVINSCSSKLHSEREGQLIERLKECGFEFETRAELINFAKTRCQLEVYPNKLNILRVDEKIVAEWWDTIEFKQDGNKITAIAGKPPSNYL